MHKVTFWLLGFVAAVGVLYYFFVHRQMKAKPVIALIVSHAALMGSRWWQSARRGL